MPILKGNKQKKNWMPNDSMTTWGVNIEATIADISNWARVLGAIHSQWKNMIYSYALYLRYPHYLMEEKQVGKYP